MQIKITLPDDKVDTMIRELMENMPESSLSLSCVKWKYEECSFKFLDNEDDKVYEVDMSKLKPAFEKMMKDILENGKLPGLGLGMSEACSWMDPCNWDAGCVDALVQYAIFGEVVYG